MPKFLLLFLFLLLAAFESYSQKEVQVEAKISVADLREDFHILHSAIGLGHPAWGQYHSIDSMETWFRQAGASITEDMTEEAFLQLLYPLIGKMGCGHTRLQRSKDFVKYQNARDKAGIQRRYPPFKVILLEDQLLVRQATSPDSNLIPIGSQVLSIDGQSALQITQTLLQHITSDGYNQTYRRRVFNSNFDGYFRFYFGEKDHYNVRLRSPGGDTLDLKLKANAATLKQRLAQGNQRKKKRLQRGTPIMQKKGYHLRMLPGQGSVAVMDIRGFRQKKGKGFYRKAFKYLKKTGTSDLILDLRDNGGGAVKDAGRLLSYLLHQPTNLVARKKRKKNPYEKYLGQKFLYNFIVPILVPLNFKNEKTENEVIRIAKFKPRKKNHFDGDLYVLINGRSFSASVMVAAYLEEEKRATFIGQETGGGQAGTNAFLMPKLTLPNSGVRMIFPLYTIEHQISAEDTGRGLMPDHEITYTLDHLLQQQDLELEKALELLAK